MQLFLLRTTTASPSLPVVFAYTGAFAIATPAPLLSVWAYTASATFLALLFLLVVHAQVAATSIRFAGVTTAVDHALASSRTQFVPLRVHSVLTLTSWRNW